MRFRGRRRRRNSRHPRQEWPRNPRKLKGFDEACWQQPLTNRGFQALEANPTRKTQGLAVTLARNPVKHAVLTRP